MSRIATLRPRLGYAFYTSLILLGFLVCQHSGKSISLQKQIAMAASMEGSADLALAELLEKLTFSLYEGAADRAEQHRFLIATAEQEKDRANVYAFVFFITGIIWIGLQLYFSKRRFAASNVDPNHLWRHVISIALLCLIIGLITPMMQMTAYKKLPVLGDVIFKYEAKSIYSTVGDLFSSGNFIIAMLITFFSIITPLTKILVVGMNVFNISPNIHQRARHLIHLLGKWSMADVFVVAILLSIFALDSQGFTRAESDLGVYFFSAYCLLSLWATHNVLNEKE